jgi:hypothetical protein
MAEINLIPLGEFVSNNTYDPRNITKDEWDAIDHIYLALCQDQWEEVISIAKARSKNIKRGSGENSKYAKRFAKKIGIK